MNIDRLVINNKKVKYNENCEGTGGRIEWEYLHQ